MACGARLQGRGRLCGWSAGVCTITVALLRAASSVAAADDLSLPFCADVKTDVIRIQVARFEKPDWVGEGDFHLHEIREEFADNEERICSSVLYFRDVLIGGVGYGIYRTEDGGVAVRVAE